MATVHGVVKAKSNKYDKYSILVNDNWYSSKYDIKAETGDTVEFDDMGKKFVRSLKVVSKTDSATPSTARRTVEPGFPVGVNTKDRSIVRQNALSHASTLVSAIFSKDLAEDKEVVTWDDRLNQMTNVAKMVVDTARIFEDYSAGDSDVAEARKMLEDMP